MSALTPTPEQQAALDAFASGGTLVIEAGAGTGKTSTLRMLGAVRPRKSGLYVAYTKPVQIEAARSFPTNVQARTAHSLAFAAFGAPMRGRLYGPRITTREAAKILRARPVRLDQDVTIADSTIAAMALQTVSNFCHSADRAISVRHFAPPIAPLERDTTQLADIVVRLARRAWDDLTAPSGRLRPFHDVYLKLWQLSSPKLPFDFILFDEAQDADPAIADVVTHQDAQLVAVGDGAQAIFGWRGARDFLDRVEAEHQVQLTQSWRFGEAIAAEANTWLSVLNARLRLEGSPHRTSIIGPIGVPDAILCRTNAGCVAEVMRAHTQRLPVALVGDGADMVTLAEAAKQFRAGQPCCHRELVAFSNWEEVQHYVEHDPGGSDLAVGVKLIDHYGPDAIIEAIRSCVPEREAALSVSTAHKAKGREWGQVRVSDDFYEPKPDPATSDPGPIPRAEAMLAYVAVTRAMTRLDTGGLAWVHRHSVTTRSKPDPAPHTGWT